MAELMRKLQALRKTSDGAGPGRCSLHGGLSRDIYCVRCRQTACAVCFDDDGQGHSGHESMSIQAATRLTERRLVADADVVREILRQVGEAEAAETGRDVELARLGALVARETEVKVAFVRSEAARIALTLRQRLNDENAAERRRRLDELRTQATRLLTRCEMLQRNDDRAYQSTTTDGRLQRLMCAGDQVHSDVDGLSRTLAVWLQSENEEVDRIGGLCFEVFPMKDFIPVDRINVVGELVADTAATSERRRLPTYVELERLLAAAVRSKNELQTALTEAETSHRQSMETVERRAELDRRRLDETSRLATSWKQRATELTGRVAELTEVAGRLEADLVDERKHIDELEETVTMLRKELLLSRDGELRLSRRSTQLEGKVERLRRSLDGETAAKTDVECQLRQTCHAVDEMAMRLVDAEVGAESRLDLYRERFVEALRKVTVGAEVSA
jgi:hypothetical protein